MEKMLKAKLSLI